MNAVWGIFSAGLARYPARRPAPRIYHYADVSNDPEVLRGCSAALEDLISRLPGDALGDPGIATTRRRFRRLSSFAYRNRLTNRAARWSWRRWDSLHGEGSEDVRKKQPQVEGRASWGDGQPLWDD